MANIVIIDDEEALAELYSFQVNSVGHISVEFTDSRKAMEHLKNNQPDLIITDIRMPHVSGIDICKFVRSNYPETGLVVVSGFSEVESELYSMGVEEILKKPFRLDELGEAVERALVVAGRVRKAG